MKLCLVSEIKLNIVWCFVYFGKPGTLDHKDPCVFFQLIEFDDPADNGFIHDDEASILVYPLLNFNWTRVLIENTTQRVAYGFIGQNYSSVGANQPQNITGTINITVNKE